MSFRFRFSKNAEIEGNDRRKLGNTFWQVQMTATYSVEVPRTGRVGNHFQIFLSFSFSFSFPFIWLDSLTRFSLFCILSMFSFVIADSSCLRFNDGIPQCHNVRCKSKSFLTVALESGSSSNYLIQQRKISRVWKQHVKWCRDPFSSFQIEHFPALNRRHCNVEQMFREIQHVLVATFL